jgi:PAS domain S-box-containing protein
MTKGNWETQSNALDAINCLSQEAIEALPAAIYTTDAEGRLTIYNEAAAELWGCHPEFGESKFCGSWKLYLPDGTPLPHDECPMAMALQQRQPIRGVEAVAERPDGTRIPFISYPTPLFDRSGKLTGAVNMLVDISARKEVEEKLRKSERESWELLGALPRGDLCDRCRGTHNLLQSERRRSLGSQAHIGQG